MREIRNSMPFPPPPRPDPDPHVCKNRIAQDIFFPMYYICCIFAYVIALCTSHSELTICLKLGFLYIILVLHSTQLHQQRPLNSTVSEDAGIELRTVTCSCILCIGSQTLQSLGYRSHPQTICNCVSIH
jgi:hypothetical protein